MDSFLNSFIQAVVMFVPLILAITLHEAAHGYIALKRGDDTALLAGRISLNPFQHIDLVGTLLIPGILYLSNAPFLIGYAKPVPVNASRLYHPKRDMIWVALAGPLMNIALMLAGAVLLKLAVNIHLESDNQFIMFCVRLIMVNAVIALFNMLPILPLDGGRVLWGLLPPKQAYAYSRLEPYGMFIVLGAVLILPWLLKIDPIGWLLRHASMGLFDAVLRLFGLL